MFLLAFVLAALIGPPIATPVQPLTRYHVLAPDQTTAQQVQQFLSTPGSLTIDFPAPPGGSLVARASYHGAVTVYGLDYYSDTLHPGQPWPTVPQTYKNKVVVPTVTGVPNETERYVGNCADALNRVETKQWQLTDFAISRWTSNTPGIVNTWTSFVRGEIAHMKSIGWTMTGEGHSYNPVARYSATSWRFTRSSPGKVRSLYVAITNAGPVRITETEYAFGHI
ncbi:MAG TPA: hypothetical protein VJN22_05225 [Candidatus Eremiobacteraceae bacterium]|nr:hypothetical protein [Candidatus Eremiobacteraceae bacterium]